MNTISMFNSQIQKSFGIISKLTNVESRIFQFTGNSGNNQKVQEKRESGGVTGTELRRPLQSLVVSQSPWSMAGALVMVPLMVLWTQDLWLKLFWTELKRVRKHISNHLFISSFDLLFVVQVSIQHFIHWCKCKWSDHTEVDGPQSYW